MTPVCTIPEHKSISFIGRKKAFRMQIGMLCRIAFQKRLTMRCVPITDCVRAVDDEAFMPMNCRFAKITVRMLGADAPMNAIMNVKGRQTKLLAAIAVLAMVVCALAIVLPSDNVQGQDIPVQPGTDGTDPLQSAINGANPGDTIILESGSYYAGTNTDYDVYTINKNITIRAAEGATVNIYGGFAIYGVSGSNIAAVDGVTLQGLNIYVQGDNNQTLNRNGITLVGKSINVTGCTFNFDNEEVLANAVTIFPYGNGTANINITGNDFIGFDSSYTGGSGTWGASGIVVAENFNVVDGRFGAGITFTTTTLGLSADAEDDLVTENDYSNCSNVYNRTDYTDGNEEPETNYTQDSTGAITQNSLGVAAGTTYTIPANTTVTYNTVNVEGTLIVNGTLNVTSLNVTGDGIVTVNGAGVVSATNAVAEVTGIDAISNVTFNNGSASNATLTGTAGTYSSGDVYIYKTGTNGTITLNGNGSQNVYFRGNGTFDGTISSVRSGVTVNSAIVATGGDNTNYFVAGNGSISVLGVTNTLGTYVTGSNITFNGATISGLASGVTQPTISLNGVAIGNATLGVNVTVGENGVVITGTLTFANGGKITTDGENLFVYGSLRVNGTDANGKIDNATGIVYTNSVSKVQPYVTTPGNVELMDSEGIVVDTPEEFLAAVESGSSFTLGANFLILTSVDISGCTINTGNYQIVVGGNEADYSGYKVIGDSNATRGSLTLNGVTIKSGNSADVKILVNDQSSITITESKIFAVVSVSDRASETISIQDSSGVNMPDEIRVGYGMNYTLQGNVSSNLSIYGNLIIESDVTVPVGSNLTVYSGGELTVNGSVTIAGTADFKDGSKTTVNGTMSLTNTEGGAKITVGETTGADFTVSAEGTVNINAVASGVASTNSLIINNTDATFDGSWSPRFLVLGTLNMNGTLSGTVHDQGTVSVSGFAGENAEIVIYDGVTLTVRSISGPLDVTDAGIMADSIYNRADTRAVSDGNVVTLDDVRNVTVSEAVETLSYRVGTVGHTDYVCNMTIAGTFTTYGTGETATGSVSTSINDGYTAIAAVGENADQKAAVYIAENVTLGEGVAIEVGAGTELVVDGTLNAVADRVSVENSGTITVNGTFTARASGGAVYTSNVGVINAVKYTVTPTDTTGDTIDTYTNFTEAIAAAPNADDDQITVLGTVTATETIDIPTGITVQMADGSQLWVAEGVTVTLVNDAKINGLSATIEVDGTFTAQDYTDLSVSAVNADVVTTEGTSRTWTSLANALASGMTDITLNRAITIDQDVTIPAGTTVTTNVAPVTEDGNTYSILVDGAKLTIDGTLTMGERTEGAIVMTDDADSEIEIGGVFSARIMDDTYDSAVNDLAGAHFGVIDGAYTTFYVSNVDFAAQTVSNNSNVLGNTVTIRGVVSAGDVSFVATDSGLTVEVVKQGDAADKMTILSAGSINLDGAKLTIDNNSRVSGTVTGPFGDGSADASMNLTNAQSLVISSEKETTEFFLRISGTYSGSIAITAGTVTVDAQNDITVGSNATLTVAQGATLSVPSGAVLTANVNSNELVENPVVIDGTIVIRNSAGLDGEGEVLVNGTMDVRDITVTTDVRVTGTIAVEQDYTLTIGNNGKVTLGEKPETLGQSGSGSITGTVVITPGTNGVIVAYAGADLSGAALMINGATGESDAASTTYNINGTAYMTVYAYENEYTVGEAAVVDGAIDLNGYDTNTNWYSNADYSDKDDNANGAQLGTYENVYSNYVASKVPGTISVGTGMTMYIDGLTIDTYLDRIANRYYLPVGTHVITIAANSNYSIENATITFNGVTVQNGGTIEITSDMSSYTLAASGATPADTTVVIDGGNGGSDMGLTDYLLIVLVILIVIMAIIVALRLMRS